MAFKPKPEPKSPYITRDGFIALQIELKGIWERRREVVKALSAAAAEGDRSENAEYIYRKKELRGLDRRIRYLQKRMPDLIVIENQPSDPNKIFFAAIVTLEKEDNDETVCYRIVGSDETDHTKGYISIDSPLAKALLGKQVDDEASVTVEGVKTQYFVIEIVY
jgi:transcription elongation factor GreB